MKKKCRIPKRDKNFQKSVEMITENWLDDHQILLNINKVKYAFGGQWRPEVYHTQRALFFALTMAFTNKHKNVHDKYSRIWIKSLFLMFGFFLFPACLDKLAQMLREFFEIKEWKAKNKSIKAEEKNTNIFKIINYLEKINKNEDILSILKKIINDKYVIKAKTLANAFKHKWSSHYLGIKTKISDYTKIEKDKNGKITKMIAPIFPCKKGDIKNLYKHIGILRKANNIFVKCAAEIDKIINFDQFYKIENGVNHLLYKS